MRQRRVWGPRRAEGHPDEQRGAAQPDPARDHEGRSTAWIGRRVYELNLPSGNELALLGRDDHVEVPAPETVLRAGDRLTIIGDSAGIHYLAQTYARPTDDGEASAET